MKAYTQLPWGRKPSTPVLLGVSELARLLDLAGPAIITNWRSRFPDFPAERVGGTQPKFDLVEVMEWLRDSGPRGREVPKIAPLEWWRQLTRAFTLAVDDTSPRNLLVAVVLLHHVLCRDIATLPEGPQRWAELTDARSMGWWRTADWVERTQPSVAGLLRPAFKGLEQATLDRLGDLHEALAGLSNETPQAILEVVLSHGRDGRPSQPQQVTQRGLAILMAALADLHRTDVVLDPAAGEGEVLAACAHLVPGVRLFGQELDRATWVVARSRLVIEQVRASLGTRPHDSLREDALADLRADVVLIDPPVLADAPPLERWLEYGLGHAAPGARVVVNLPLHALVQVASARRRRDERVAGFMHRLVADGVLEGAVLLLHRTRTDVPGPTLLCRLRPGRQAQGGPPAPTTVPVVVLREDPSADEAQLVALSLARAVASPATGAAPAADEFAPVAALAADRFLDDLADLHLRVSAARSDRSMRGARAALRARVNERLLSQLEAADQLPSPSLIAQMPRRPDAMRLFEQVEGTETEQVDESQQLERLLRRAIDELRVHDEVAADLLEAELRSWQVVRRITRG